MALFDRPEFRHARPPDAEAIATLHAESWRRYYRGAYSDHFLDADVHADRSVVWNDRLRRPAEGDFTIIAVIDDAMVGFAHTIFDEDPEWGALLENLHVASAYQRHGIGATLLRLSASAVVENAPGSGLYLWVLEQNVEAQAFYQSLGGSVMGRTEAQPPGGIAGRLNGSPMKLRIAWPDPSALS